MLSRATQLNTSNNNNNNSLLKGVRRARCDQNMTMEPKPPLPDDDPMSPLVNASTGTTEAAMTPTKVMTPTKEPDDSVSILVGSSMSSPTIADAGSANKFNKRGVWRLGDVAVLLVAVCVVTTLLLIDYSNSKFNAKAATSAATAVGTAPPVVPEAPTRPSPTAAAQSSLSSTIPAPSTPSPPPSFIPTSTPPSFAPTMSLAEPTYMPTISAAPSVLLSQRAILVTDHINSIKLSTAKTLAVPMASAYYDLPLDSLTLEEKALAWLIYIDPLHLVPDTETSKLRLQQRYALLTLPWESFHYLDSVNECDWTFVQNCTKSTAQATLGVDVVTEIVLYGSARYQYLQGSTGTLSPDVGLLNSLVVFDVQSAGLTGSLPPSLGANWLKLKWFGVSKNDLTGSIPASLGTSWTNLKFFHVTENVLTGSLPSALGTTWTNLKEFYVENNALTGSLPSSLGTTWTNLEWFVVNYNTLTGSLPSSLGTTWTNLLTFFVFHNDWTGSLPSSLGTTWTNLAWFWVSGSALTGSIPPSLGTTWRNLITFWVGSSALTGSLPTSLGATWTNLDWFIAEDNVLVGSIPQSLGTTWTSLGKFAVDNNTLTGSLPSSLGKTWTNLKEFDVHRNTLTGSIPDLASHWNNLSVASFEKNSFVGSMPRGFCSIAHLTSLRADCDEVDCICCNFCCSNATGKCRPA